MLLMGQIWMSTDTQQSGLLSYTESYIKQQLATNSKEHHQFCYQLYCLLIDQLSQQKQEALLQNATEGLLQHYLPTLYPKAPVEKATDTDRLKKEITKLLNQHWQTSVKLKESFTSNDNNVEFSLKAQCTGYHPLTLIQVSGDRLKTTRMNACKQLLGIAEDTPSQLPKLEAKPIKL